MIDIGFDVGGTFIDVVVHDRRAETWQLAKVLVPDSIELGVLRAIQITADVVGSDISDVAFLGHGTTVSTNMVIEETGAKVGLITTRGFRDVLELGRQDRPSVYDSRMGRPPALVPRDLRLEVDERIGPEGNIARQLDTATVDRAIDQLIAASVDAVAVCLLHSWRNPSHERLIGVRLARRLPSAFVVLSSDVAAQYREYERTSTAVVSAYVGPRIARYLGRVEATISERGIRSPLWVMQSSGGLASVSEIVRHPAVTQVSGPAAGVLAAQVVASRLGEANFVAFDVGGTSTDVTLVQGFRPEMSRQRHVRGRPVLGNSIAVHSIGAGGGSIAWIDDAGLLKVGPRSAGANPGPACYGRGGMDATVTDAHVVLGYISLSRPLARELHLSPELARAAIARLAHQLDMAIEAVANGIIEIATANMVRALRRVTIETGHDPREFALVAYGGGGPLHAGRLIEEMGMRCAIVPAGAGAFSAVGLLSAAPRVDITQTCVAVMSKPVYSKLDQLFKQLAKEALRRLALQGFKRAGMTVHRELDMRYVGQSHDLAIALDPTEDGMNFERAVEAFHDAHLAKYGIAALADKVESVTAHVIATVPRPAAVFSVPSTKKRIAGVRRWWCGLEGFTEVPALERSGLQVGETISGPGFIDSDDATVAIPPNYVARVMDGGILQLSRVEEKALLQGDATASG